MSRDEFEIQARHFGSIFGYPECCIEEFVQIKGTIHRDQVYNIKHERSIFAHSGFFPCSKCIDKDHEELKTEINKARAKEILPLLG